jgi:hypothetical protein
MRKVLLLLSLFTLVIAQEITKTKKEERKELIQNVVKLGAYVADKAIDSRHEIYKTVTGKDLPEYLQKKNVDETASLLQESAVDLTIGRIFRKNFVAGFNLFMQSWMAVVALVLITASWYLKDRRTRTN